MTDSLPERLALERSRSRFELLGEWTDERERKFQAICGATMRRLGND